MDRAKAAVLEDPNKPAAAIAREIGVSKKTVLNAKNALNIATRNTAKMARVEAAVLANPDMSARALAKQLGIGKTTVLRARERLKSKRGENPVSEVPVEGEAVPQP
jgi:DNA-binding Lrp family transcriptional regulator